MSKIYTAEQKQWLKDNIEGKYIEEITDMFNEKFDTSFTFKQIRTLKDKLKLKSGLNGKNGVFPRERPIGYEFKKPTGYIYVKAGKGDNWVPKQRYVYEQYYGKIPEGYSVVFANSNKEDFDIDNLILVKEKELLVASKSHLFSDDKEITESGLLIAKLINRTCEIKQSKERKE